MESNELFVATEKGHRLTATQFVGDGSLNKTIVISSATGVLQGYYKKFAQHFASLGYTVYTFDYYGIGKSGSEISTLKANTSDLKNWGSNDQSAMVAQAKKRHPHNDLILLGHSVAGQILGFNTSYNLVDKVVLVASQSGYWKYFKGWHCPKMWLLWHVVIPMLTPVLGYFPSKKMRLFENLPKRMVYEWSKWGRHPDYMMGFYDKQKYFFDRVRVPLLSWSFPRDPFAPQETVDWLTRQYKNAKVDRIHYIPPENQLNKLRHFGFFREAFRDTLWKKTDEWIRKV